MKLNRITAIASAAVMAITMAMPAFAAEETFETITKGLTLAVNGDINGDGKVNVTDISKTAAHVKGVSAIKNDAAFLADVNEDHRVNVTDISLIAANVKGTKKLAVLNSGSEMRKSRKIIDNSDSYTIQTTQRENDKINVMDVSRSGDNYSIISNSSSYMILYNGKHYSIDTEKKLYTVSEFNPNSHFEKDMADVMLGKMYEYIGCKKDGDSTVEVYLNPIYPPYLYAYYFKDGVLSSTKCYSQDGNLLQVEFTKFEPSGTVTLPDLSGYTKE